MKNWFFLFVAFYSLIFASPIQDHKIDPTAFAQLVSALHIQGPDFISETQKQWLRKPFQERWEMVELPSQERDFVLKWAKEQGMFAPWRPSCTSYDKALILGATAPRMQTRLEYLKKLWNEGIRFSEIVWLTGERALVKSVDGLLTDRCNNESEAACVIWKEADLPKGMRALPVIFISVPMENALQRPTTQSTLIAWLKAYPTPCTALFVSDQPFCGYQFATVKSILPYTFSFDLVGEGENPNAYPNLPVAAIVLDAIARWIYQESVIFSSKSK